MSHGEERIVFEDDEEEEEDAPVQLKRLRRGARFADDEPAEHDDEDEENGPPSSQPEPKPRNAFDVLRQGPPSPVVHSKKRKSAFVEGEAEESDDEDLAASKHPTDAGGLKGVFADDDSNHSANDSDSEDDADAPDLDNLVDNERDLDEASKDEIARARFREDMEARDREDLEIHRKAVEVGSGREDAASG